MRGMEKKGEGEGGCEKMMGGKEKKGEKKGKGRGAVKMMRGREKGGGASTA
jgi:hypothetical protein